MPATYKRIIEERLVHEIFSGDYFVKDHATEGTTRILVSEFIDLILAGSASEEDLETVVHNFVPEYDSGTSYSVGNYCIYLNELYRCTTATTGAFDDNDWTTTNVMSELVSLVNAEATARTNADNQLASGIGKQMSNLADFYDTTKSYVVGDVCVLQSGELMRCIAPTSGTFDNTKWEQITVDELIADEASARTTAINNEAYYRSMDEAVLAENIAEPYDTTKSYAVGDLVTHQLYVYRCISATTGTWDASKWEQITVDELFDALNFSADAISYDNTSSGLEADNAQDAIDETITKLSAVGSASGDIATFNDGSDLSMPKLEVAIEPVQDLHGYDSPWVGGSHANKWDEQWESGTYNPSTGSKTTDVSRIRNKNLIKVSASTTYYFVKPSGKLVYLYYYDVNNDFISYADPFQTSGTGGTFTTPSNAEYLCFSILQTSYSSGIAVNFPSSVTTYSPYSNICPISGWDEVNVSVSGVNVWDEEWEPGQYNGTTGNKEVSSTKIRCKNLIQVKPETKYYYKGAGYGADLLFYGANKDFISYKFQNSNATFTTTDQTYYIAFSPSSSYGTTYNNDISINYPSTDTDYHAYNGHTYTIDLDGTRYGGKVDLVSGVLTVTHGYLNLNTANLQGTNQYASWYNCGVKNIVKSGINSNISNINNFGFSQYICANTTNGGDTLFIMNSYTGITLAQWQAMAIDCQFVIPMFTPQAIQLTPTLVKSLKGVNNVYADCGEILDAEYIRDMNTTINDNLAKLDSLPSPASSNGDYVIRQTNGKMSLVAGSGGGTTYTAGNNIQISAQNVISATDTKYTAGTGISISGSNVISNSQNVTANPSGTATNELKKLQIGSAIFSIPGVRDYYLQRGDIGGGGSTTLPSINLAKNLVEGLYLMVVNDTENMLTTAQWLTWNNSMTTLNLSIQKGDAKIDFTLNNTNGTVTATWYTGAYRSIYLSIIKLDGF